MTPKKPIFMLLFWVLLSQLGWTQSKQEVLIELGDETLAGSYQLSNGDFLLLGRTTKVDPSGDFFITRINASLEPIWSYSYGIPGNIEIAFSALELSNGNILISGYRDNSYVSINFEISQAGDIIAGTPQEIGSFQDRLHLITPTSDGGYFLYGMLERAIGLSNRFTAYKYDNMGVLEWSKYFNQAPRENTNGEVHSRDAVRHPDGSTVFLTVYANFGAPNTDRQIRIFNLKDNGDVNWIKGYDYGGYARPSSITATADGGFLFTGAYANDNTVDDWDLLVQKINSSGELVWQYTYGSDLKESGNDILEINGEIFVAGYVTNEGTGEQQALLLRLTGDGDIISADSYLDGNEDQLSLMHWDGSQLTLFGNTNSYGIDKDVYLFSGHINEIAADTCHTNLTPDFQKNNLNVILLTRDYPEGSPPGFESSIVNRNTITFQKELVCQSCFVELDVEKDTLLCEGDSLVVEVANPGGLDVLWNDGSTELNRVFHTAGTYWVELGNEDCSERDSIVIDFDPLPEILLGKDTTFCDGDSLKVEFAVPLGTNFIWNDGYLETTRTIKQAGVYWVEVDNGLCSNRDSLVVQVEATPSVDLGPDSTLCLGDSIVLTATHESGFEIEWEDGSNSPTRKLGSEGLYWVEVNNGLCTARDSVQLLFEPLPEIKLRPDTTLCEGDSLEMIVEIPDGSNYVWNDGYPEKNRFLKTQGDYWLEITLGGCTTRDSITLTITPFPALDLGPDAILCDGDSLEVNLNYPPEMDVLWNDGSSNQNRVFKTNGEWWVEVANESCLKRDSIQVEFYPVPEVDLGPDKTLCLGDSLVVELTIPDGHVVVWNDGLETGSRVLRSSGLFWVEMAMGSCTSRDSINMNFLEIPVVDLGPDTALCAGDSILVYGFYPPEFEVTWENGTSDQLRSLDQIGLYWLEVKNDICVERDSLVVDILDIPAVDLGPNHQFCEGESVTLELNFPPNYTAHWNDGTTELNKTFTSSGTYWLEVGNKHCLDRDSIEINVIAMPIVNLGPDTALCEGESFELEVNFPPDHILTWEDGSQLSSRTIFNSGEFWLKVENRICSHRDSIVVSFNSPPIFNLGPDTTLCSGDSVHLNLGFNDNYKIRWNDGYTLSERTLKTSGEYWADVTLGNCGNRDSIVLEVLDFPQVNLGPDSILCSEDSIVLGGTYPQNYTIEWEDGSQLPERTLDAPGEYWMQVSNQMCASVDSVSLAFWTKPQLNLGLDSTLCEGDSVLLDLDLQEAYDFVWNDGYTATQRTLKTSGIFWAELSVGRCVERDSIEVNFLAFPVFDLGPDTTLCLGDSIQVDLSSNSGNVIVWEDNSSVIQRSLKEAGLYWVEVANQMCSTRDSLDITLRNLPQIDLGPDVDTCGQNPIALTLNSNPNFQAIWENGSNATNRNIVSSGEYWVRITDDLGCQNADTIILSFWPYPQVNLGPDVELCEGEQHALNIDPDEGTPTWSGIHQGYDLIITESELISVIVVNDHCISMDTVQVTFNPIPEIDLGPDSILCEGDSILLDAFYSGASYYWTGSKETQSMRYVDEGGEYTVSLELDGCSYTDSIFLEEIPAPYYHLEDTTICLEAELRINLDPGLQYSWANPDPENEGPFWRIIDEGGNYTLTTTNICGSFTESFAVEIDSNCYCNVYVPNAFTPNGDGFNPTFQAKSGCDFLEFEFWIFDRWGEELFYAQSIDQVWDGTVNGNLVQIGVYVWMIRYRFESTRTDPRVEKGHVTVLR